MVSKTEWFTVRQLMRRPPNNGVGYIIDLQILPFPVALSALIAHGLLLKYQLTLGHFGLPHIKGEKPVINQFEDKKEKLLPPP